MIGLEPITCWLQISCSANWATSAYVFISWFVISCSVCDQLTSLVVLYELSHIGTYRHAKRNDILFINSHKRTLFWESFQMTPTGIEPVLPPWKGDVLTAWPWGLKNSPSRARTYNNSVNSRVLYHWAIEDYIPDTIFHVPSELHTKILYLTLNKSSFRSLNL